MIKPHPFNIVKRHNYMQALHMLCVKLGWTKEYSYYILGRSPECCANGGKREFIKKATRILAYNYAGIHTGEDPAQSPRLLPESNPLSQPLRMPPEFEGESKCH